MRILIAEDDFVSRRVLEKTLRSWNYDVISTQNGAEAWRILQSENPPPMVILDWMMPELDGLELVKMIRSKNSGNYVYTILLTARKEKEDLLAGFEQGVDDFLTKPFDRDELRARLRSGERIIQLEHTLARNNKKLEIANEKISAANARMKKDLEAAAKIQKSLLPHEVPNIKGVDISWLYHPCEELAGDIFNVHQLDERHLGLYILDVSGHGVPAALLSVTLSRILSTQTGASTILLRRDRRHGKYVAATPLAVVEELNQRFSLDMSTGQYFTLIYATLDLQSHALRLVSAGHPNPIHVRGDVSGFIEATGLPIGFSDEVPYSEVVLNLKPGDRVFFYSDALTETVNSRKEQFGERRLLECIRRESTKRLKDVLPEIREEIKAFSNRDRFMDDFTLFAFEIGNSGDVKIS
jgi:sigma-B regulation protein RsbU (phosphoserine phosphatase)